MKVVDGKNAVMGRLASYVAKEVLRGEEIVVVNCNEVIITGNRKNIEEEFEATRKRVGSTQKGPKISRIPERIVKRAIRGMLPNVRHNGRGRQAFKDIRCYAGVPKEFENVKMVEMKHERNKFINVKDLAK